jgi:hypothetical protein
MLISTCYVMLLYGLAGQVTLSENKYAEVMYVV